MSCDYTAVAAGRTCQAEVVDCAVELVVPGSGHAGHHTSPCGLLRPHLGPASRG